METLPMRPADEPAGRARQDGAQPPRHPRRPEDGGVRALHRRARALGPHRTWTAAEAELVAANDGATIYYGPGFEALPLPVQVGMVAHQVLHVALRHPQRAMRSCAGCSATSTRSSTTSAPTPSSTAP
jgi:hypothetical protein